VGKTAALLKHIYMACSRKELNTDRSVELNIKAKRNDTFNPFVTLLENGSPFDFTGYDEASMQIKTRADSTTVVLLLTIANGGITLGNPDPTDGVITFSISKADMDVEANTYVYDLEIVNTTSGVRETVLDGTFQIVNDVTRV
jgi:hypothetical protein